MLTIFKSFDIFIIKQIINIFINNKILKSKILNEYFIYNKKKLINILYLARDCED